MVADFREQLNLPKDQLTLMYLGSIGTWYMLDEMLGFFKRIDYWRNARMPSFCSSRASRKTRYWRQRPKLAYPPSASSFAPPNARNCRPCSHSQTLGIFFIRPTFSKTASSPTKQGEMMALGMPLICNTGVGDTDRVVEQCNAGALVSQFTDTDYDAVIDDLDNILALNKERIKAGAEAWYSLENGVQKYREVYANLIGK